NTSGELCHSRCTGAGPTRSRIVAEHDQSAERRRTWYVAKTPWFLAQVVLPTYSQRKTCTPSAAARAANASLAYTCPGGVTGSKRAARLTWLPLKVSFLLKGSVKLKAGPACKAIRNRSSLGNPTSAQHCCSIQSASASAS